MICNFRKIVLSIAGGLLCLNLFASESGEKAFIQGLTSYSAGNWTDAQFSLKKAAGYTENFNPDTYYMLITAEVNAKDDKSALDDCDIYLESFPDSIYYSRVAYQKGKLLYNLGEYEKAIVCLSDFCHQFSDDELYTYALFYIGESLFAGYKYDDAAQIYERIVADYPDCPKAAAAQYRLETIMQRSREEKLLYLLKQTGEEYLSAKEEYEKQLRVYNAENLDTTRRKLVEAQNRNSELEKQVQDLQKQLSVLQNSKKDVSSVRVSVPYEDDSVKNSGFGNSGLSDGYDAGDVDVPNNTPYDETQDLIKMLKQKALDAQRLMDSKKR